MDEPNQAPAQSPLTLAAKIGWAALIVVTLYVCYFSHLGALGFVGPDEPRYAWVAREMVESGDWVTPRLYGKPWFEKPVLYYWGAALSFKLFGVSEAAARLPSALSALLATLALAWLAWRIYGGETARWLLLLPPTTVGMIGFSHAAAMDMPFTGMLTVAMVAAAVVLGLTRGPAAPSLSLAQPRPPTPWLALVIFGVFLGAAVLAKGPAAIILCGGAVLVWALFTRRWRDAFRLLHPAAVASFCASALPWYIVCARRNPDFFRVFIIEHNFQRYLTPEFHHIQPFWFYIPILCIGASPWCLLVLVRSRDLPASPPDNSNAKPTLAFIWSWVLFPVLFFSLSKSKLPGYILPSLPGVAFLSAKSTARILAVKSKKSGWVLAGYGVLFLAVGMAWAIVENGVSSGQDIVPAPWQTEITLLLVVGALVVTTFAIIKRFLPAMLACIITVLALANRTESALPWIDPIYSSRLAPQSARKFSPEFSAEGTCVYRLSRGLTYGLNFYLHHELPECPGNLKQYRWVFTAYREESTVEMQGFRCPRYWVFPGVVTCATLTPSTDNSYSKPE
jgi:4-amino-4-deoxy-L-arabinose transferase-like glycosyltransferase